MALKQCKVLIKGKFLPPQLIENIEQSFTAFRLWEAEDEAAFLAEQGTEIDILVTSGNAVMGAPAALIAALPNLKAICSNGVGYDSIDTEAARSRGIVVTNTPEVLNDCVADLGMALLLDVARRISEADRFTRAGHWAQGRFPLSSKIGGKVCGIVGLGNIGQAVARRAQAFDMQIHYYNPRSRSDVPYTRHESLVDLAQRADFLVADAARGGCDPPYYQRGSAAGAGTTGLSDQYCTRQRGGSAGAGGGAGNRTDRRSGAGCV